MYRYLGATNSKALLLEEAKGRQWLHKYVQVVTLYDIAFEIGTLAILADLIPG
jgi:hypothetical protein